MTNRVTNDAMKEVTIGNQHNRDLPTLMPILYKLSVYMGAIPPQSAEQNFKGFKATVGKMHLLGFFASLYIQLEYKLKRIKSVARSLAM